MTIKITPSMLCDLCAPKFTYDACEAICEFFDECGVGPDGENAPSLGDICVSFSEVPADWRSDYEDDVIIAELQNGNIVVLN